MKLSKVILERNPREDNSVFGTKYSKSLPNIAIWKAFAEIRTKRRIILSGTPFQNNFGELHTIMPRLLPANDEAMDFFNTLTQGMQPLDPSRRSLTLDPSTTLDPRTLGDP